MAKKNNYPATWYPISSSTIIALCRGMAVHEGPGGRLFVIREWRGKQRTFGMLRAKCSVCGDDTFVDTNNAKTAKKVSCSAACRILLRMGSNNKLWKGRKHKRGTKGGPVLVYAPEHPGAKKGYVYEHRVVVEAQLCRYLTAEEFVHHVDNDDQNNDIENLLVVSSRQHKKLHASVQKLLKPLMALGIIAFDRAQMKYFVVGGLGETAIMQSERSQIPTTN